MTKSVVFSTPGLIPIEAFTTFGMNAKPNSTNPFGFFGTGLKIAIAVCLRMDQEVVIWRGRDKYTFYTKKEDFRGKEFQKVRMKRETWHIGDIFKKAYIELPFTTELGKHWDLWQAFREFHTNTTDEGGIVQIEYWSGDSKHIHDDRSLVQVTGQKFLDEYFDRGRNFLPDGLTERVGSDGIQVLDRPSKHVYYRGVRVWDLKEESIYTYNFLQHVDLTEDRTAKYPFLLESYICDLIKESEDEAFLKKTVAAPRENTFERNLGYRYSSSEPSSYFKAAAVNSPVVAAKELVRVAETKVDVTYLTVRIPKKATDEEVEDIRGYIQHYFPGTFVERSE